MHSRLLGIYFLALSFVLSSCSQSSNKLSLGLNQKKADTVVTLIDNKEQSINLKYNSSEVSNPTTCDIIDPVNISITTPCTCVAGICTVGVTPTGSESASFDYTVQGSSGSFGGTAGITFTEVVPFVSSWRVGNGSYGDGDNTVTLPLRSGYKYDFTVDWGDGASAQVTSHDDIDINHTYSTPGDYTITITGLVEAFTFNNTGDKGKIISIPELGTVGWNSFASAFVGCSNLTTVSGGETSNVTSMRSMFTGANALTVNSDNWNTSNVTDMRAMFSSTTNVTVDTSNWDTSRVTDMSFMFFNADSVTIDTSKWDTSNVTDMSRMFMNASNLNPDTSSWDTSKVTDMSRTFQGVDFTPNTTNWDTSSVTTMYWMFSSSQANPDTSNWETSNVTDMNGIFKNADQATPDTSNWDTSNVTDMTSMFEDSALVNPDTSSWNTSKVEYMTLMFNNTNVATPDTSGWDTSSVTDMEEMFMYALVANPNTSGWDTSNVTNMHQFCKYAPSCDPDMSSWDFTAVTDMGYMFTGAGLSTANYDNVLIRLDATMGSGGTFNAGTAKYTAGSAAATAKSNLETRSWYFTDGGSI